MKSGAEEVFAKEPAGQIGVGGGDGGEQMGGGKLALERDGLRDKHAPAPMIEYFYHENVPPEQEGGPENEGGDSPKPAEEVKDQLY